MVHSRKKSQKDSTRGTTPEYGDGASPRRFTLPEHGFSDDSQTATLFYEHTWVDAWAKPVIILSRESYENTKARLGHAFPQKASLSLVRDWIARCELQHEDLCSRSHQPMLRDLRVIDCEDRRIVAAPPQCKLKILCPRDRWTTLPQPELFDTLRSSVCAH